MTDSEAENLFNTPEPTVMERQTVTILVRLIENYMYIIPVLPSFLAIADIVTAAWAFVDHDCDVRAEDVIDTSSSRYSRMPASVPETRHVMK